MSSETPHTVDNIRVEVYDREDAPTAEAAADASPKRVHETHNTTRDSYHEAVVGALAGQSVDLTVDVLALGDSTLATADVADGTPLGNELFRIGVTDSFTAGQTFTASTFLGAGDGNGNTFNEAALVAEQSSGDFPINRFLISDQAGLLSPKSANETVTIDIEITQEDA